MTEPDDPRSSADHAAAIARVRADLAAAADPRDAPPVPPEVTARIVEALRDAAARAGNSRL